MAAIMPYNQEVMPELEDTSQSVQQSMRVMISVQGDSSVVTKARPKTFLRHHSLLFNALSATEHSHPSSAKIELSSNNDRSLRRSMSGPLNPHWKLGDSWLTLRHGKESASESTSLSSLNGASGVTNISASKQREPEISVVENFNENEERKSRLNPWKECRIGKPWQTGGNGKDVNSAFTESHSIESPNTSSDVANWISSSRHLDFVSDTTSIGSIFPCVDLNVFSSDKLGSNLEASPGSQLESCNASLSSRWREIQGAKNWEGLLDPLDLDLRRELLRYGDFAQTTYDNLVCETRSKYAGSARFPKQTMFKKLHKQGNGYQVTRYLYATCQNPLPGALQSSLSSERWDVESNWMGYVAVATEPQEIERLGRRDIVVAWRGTVRTIEWLIDAQIQMAQISLAADNPGLCPKVEKGFWNLYTCKRSTSQFNQNSASEQVIAEITSLLKLYKGENLSITLTGHSLGGALAILTAYEIAALGLNKTSSGQEEIIPVTVFTFGSPHVGDAVFRKAFEEMHGLKALRVVEVYDLVPKTIPKVYFPWMETYKHVGVALQIDHTRSPYLRRTRDPLDWHSLECYLHLVDGHQGRNSSSFALVTGRDYALLNKYANILEARYCIPPNWWQVENKGLELSSEGRWIEPDRSLEDTPSLVNHERFV